MQFRNVVYLFSVNVAGKSMWVALKPSLGIDFHAYKSYFRAYARKLNQGTLKRGKIIPQVNFLAMFSKQATAGNLMLLQSHRWSIFTVPKGIILAT